MRPDYRSTAVVGLALMAHLDAFDRTGSEETGRKRLQLSMGLRDPARVTEVLKGNRPEALLDLARGAERAGIVPHGEVLGLAAQIRLADGHQGRVSGAWWPRLRDANELTGSEPAFRKVIDVLVCADAFCDHYADVVLGRSPRKVRRVMAADDDAALGVLVHHLCRIAIGPYGAAQEALRLLGRLAPLVPDQIAEEVGVSPISTQLVRALELAIRHGGKSNAELWGRFQTLLATPPPGPLAIKVYWLRALRRFLITDRSSASEAEERRWVYGQLERALIGDGAYEDASLTDRRFALWCLAEAVESPRAWTGYRARAEADPGLEDLLPLCEQFREAPRRGYDGFAFTPRAGWPKPASAREALSPDRVQLPAWSQRKHWMIVRPYARARLINMLEDALLAPSAIRQRAATDLLRASGPAVRNAASTTVDELLQAELAATVPRVDFIERVLRLLGVLGSERSIDQVERVLRSADPDSTVRSAAIAAASDLAHRHPASSVGMMAWLNAAISTSSTRSRAVAGIRAATSFGKDPVDFFDSIPHADDPGVERCIAWARDVLADPLRPRRT